GEDLADRGALGLYPMGRLHCVLVAVPLGVDDQDRVAMVELIEEAERWRPAGPVDVSGQDHVPGYAHARATLVPGDRVRSARGGHRAVVFKADWHDRRLHAERRHRQLDRRHAPRAGRERLVVVRLVRREGRWGAGAGGATLAIAEGVSKCWSR